jgi:exosome complex RNA-binding protein Csl4
MMSYDTWKLSTPEEHYGVIVLTCADCGDPFDSYDPDATSCPTCEGSDDNE